MESLSKKRLLVLVTVTLLLTAATATAESVRSDQFQLNFPSWCGKVNKHEQRVASPNGDLNVVTYTGKTADGACILSYSEFSGVIKDPDATIRNGRTEFLRSLGIKATVNRESERTVSGFPGQTFTFSAAEPRPIFGRTDLIVAGKRLYQVVYVGFTPESLSQAESSDLFQSLTVKVPEKTPSSQQAKANAAPNTAE